MSAWDRLAQIQDRAEKATPGVWKIWGMQVMADQKGTSVVDDAVLVAQTYLSNDSGEPRTFDAQFIAQAHQDVPALVAALEEVLDVCAEIRANNTATEFRAGGITAASIIESAIENALKEDR